MSLKLEKKVAKIAERMVTRSNEKIDPGLMENIDANIREQEERLAACDEQLAQLGASKTNLDRIPKLQHRRAELATSLASLKGERASLENIKNAIYGLRQHEEIQKLFRTLDKIDSSSSAEKQSGNTLAAAQYTIRLLGQNAEFQALAATLQTKLNTYTPQAVTMTKDKEKLLGRIKGEPSVTQLVKSDGGRRRFGIILSKRVAEALNGTPEAAKAARQDVVKLRQIMNGNPALRKYIMSQPHMIQLMRQYDDQYNVILSGFTPPSPVKASRTFGADDGIKMDVNKLTQYGELVSSERAYGSKLEFASQFIRRDNTYDADITWGKVYESETDPYNKLVIKNLGDAIQESVVRQKVIESELDKIPWHKMTKEEAQEVFKKFSERPEFTAYMDNLALCGVLHLAMIERHSSIEPDRTVATRLGEVKIPNIQNGEIISHDSLSKYLIEPGSQRWGRWGLFAKDLGGVGMPAIFVQKYEAAAKVHIDQLKEAQQEQWRLKALPDLATSAALFMNSSKGSKLALGAGGAIEQVNDSAAHKGSLVQVLDKLGQHLAEAKEANIDPSAKFIWVGDHNYSINELSDAMLKHPWIKGRAKDADVKPRLKKMGLIQR